MEVKAWSEVVVIPTYGIGQPEKNPIFLEKRVYQGSSGSVYPHPVVEKIEDVKQDVEWNAVFLENRYLKIMILPELGGRVQMAYDKVKQRHFVYYNQVIKPALVGLTGPWISGGIEFNWPQHHRPSTYQPTSWCIEENSDGSKTVWCNEVERMFRTKGMAGFTLYPDSAYMEIKVKLYNRTALPQTFLWWANPAVKVNNDYQSVFPPDVHAVYDHGKRDVSSFPIATGTYYKVDYSEGVDISRYKNIPVPTSYMAVESKYNFVGGYENDTKGGLLHVANHHVSPGKKQWTWGHGDFGRAWDRNLTDEDGPYIELMCGVYTDNQPDFSWLMPYEERDFRQYFMPYRDLGMVKNATKEALVNLEVDEKGALIKVYTTSVYKQATVCLKVNGVVAFESKVDFSPEMSFEQLVELQPSGINAEDLYVVVKDSSGKILVDYCPEKPAEKPIPEPAKAALQPADVDTIEGLFLTGLHLEQYRHATYNPTDYYQEALRRDPKDVRCNNAMGLWLVRHGKFADAEPYLQQAVAALTERNPNPYDGEPLFNLGVCLRFQGKNDDAFGKFYKSTWNAALQDAAYFNLAQLSSIKQNWDEALDTINRSLIRNWHNHKARHLKIAILRKMGRLDQARLLVQDSLQLDQFNIGTIFEQWILENTSEVLLRIKELTNKNIHDLIEYSLDYAAAGMYDEAIELLGLGVDCGNDTYPMVYYLMGWYAMKAPYEDQPDELNEPARDYLKKAACMRPDYCFPNRLEEVVALQFAIKANRFDSKAPYYLGNFWYNAREYSMATACWEKARELDCTFPTAHRNLALSYYNKQGKPQAALAELEEAFKLNTRDARILMELDQLYKKLNYPYKFRLELLEKHPDCLSLRDDLLLEQATLYNMLGGYSKALELLSSRHFHPWEGGEGKVTGQYVYAHTELGKQALRNGDYSQAIVHFNEAQYYPDNLGEGKLTGALENDILYYQGCAYSALGNTAKAEECWTLAAKGQKEPSNAFFYNDQQPDKIFYQGLSLRKLGYEREAIHRFKALSNYGELHFDDQVKIDYFAVSLPDLLIWEEDLNRRNAINCSYLMALGFLGQGRTEKAIEHLRWVLSKDVNHQGAVRELTNLN